MNSRRLKAVARALTEGHPVDWASLERHSNAGDRTRLRHLRSLAELAGAGPDAPADAPRPVTTPGGWALHAVTAIAAIQAALAATGFVYGLAAGDMRFPVVLQGSAVLALLLCSALLVRAGADSRARTLAALLLLLASAAGRRFLGPFEVPVLSPLLRGLHPDAFLPLFAWLFVRDFPRILRFSRTDSICAAFGGVSAAAGVVLLAANLLLAWLPSAGGSPGLSALGRGGTSVYWAVVFGLMAPALLVMMARIRHAPTSERRRVGLFLAGVFGGLLPVVLIVGLEIASETIDRLTSQPEVLAVVDAVIYASILSIPFTTTYAVLVQRVLAVRLVVRRTIRYALARQTLLAAIVVPLALLAAWIVRHRQQTIETLFTGAQALTALTLAAAALVLLSVRQRVLRFLDRRYFREQVDLNAALAGFTESLSDARDGRHVAELLEHLVERVLQVEHVDLYVDAGTRYAPLRGRGAPLDRASAIGAMLEASPDPIDLEASGLARLLPASDRAWLTENRVQAIAPISQADRVPAFIAVGHRRSEQELSPEALVFLATAAAAAGLALQRSAARPSDGRRSVQRDHPAAECETCLAVVAPDASLCACGGRLRAAALPKSLAGKFDVTHRLGAGGMGVVYRARDLALARDVALKTLPRLTQAAADRLRQEAQAMARAAHPSLATVHGVETWRGAPVLVMELLEGGTLADRTRRGPLPRDEAVLVALRTVRCLGHLHGQGLLHRDVKPANIGFTASGQLKLLDFGLAAVLNHAMVTSGPGASDAATSGIAGTPLYLPPEAFDGAAPDRLVDLWGAAMVLFESLAGRHPLSDAASLGEALSRLREGRLPDVRRFTPDCPAPLAAFLRDALAADPAARPPTADVFLRDLASAAPGLFDSPGAS